MALGSRTRRGLDSPVAERAAGRSRMQLKEQAHAEEQHGHNYFPTYILPDGGVLSRSGVHGSVRTSRQRQAHTEDGSKREEAH
jgi:hypothetical protein